MCNYTARDSATRRACRVTLQIVRARVNHNTGTAGFEKRVLAVGNRDLLGYAHDFDRSILTHLDVAKVASVLSLRVQLTVLSARRIEVASGRLKIWRFATARLVDMEPMSARRKAGKAALYSDAPTGFR